MAEILIATLKLKQEVGDSELDQVKMEIERKLKATIKKEKKKGKRLEWFVKAKKPELFEETGIFTAFKRAKLGKLLQTVEIAPLK